MSLEARTYKVTGCRQTVRLFRNRPGLARRLIVPGPSVCFATDLDLQGDWLSSDCFTTGLDLQGDWLSPDCQTVSQQTWTCKATGCRQTVRLFHNRPGLARRLVVARPSDCFRTDMDLQGEWLSSDRFTTDLDLQGDWLSSDCFTTDLDLQGDMLSPDRRTVSQQA